ncbi:hypothetical protein SUGI_0952910 [Cryptomeria japonica]|uniref:uncharacterized protein LOC131070517 isoform X2 n=1 Tax=Cryptomeria japonica TaxID=3369 RepID=UPI002414B051|nr:uncharacterized protein LOC131070517 isoform X2 [Cryptomeria japonica]XP_057862079.2 uncharacterized protein LOC131070517 isoform X2 [Cryptomeria japonica]XP_057862087.2 uncharacterized protein LOC131070517 isoform X2 [Cryptomeria japonica]XP_059067216.1 uncharacterized protein LOC131070517 isoform X2 [Cryptomeria japonica]GLJ45275.1 hypothetical protein SUGI_0952910 [Cryptomeria japonica]
MAIQLGLPPFLSKKQLMYTVGNAAPQMGLRNFMLLRSLHGKKRRIGLIVAESLDNVNSASGSWGANLRQGAPPCASDIVWPAAGAFVAMSIMGHVDKMIAPKGLQLTIAPFGAVCAVLFSTPAAPAARKYNMFVSHIGCALLGVIALTIFGSGWIARSVALAASVAFMLYTGSLHPPAAGLPLLLIDAPKFQHLHWWYSIFPGAAGCILLCLLQEVVTFLKSNYKF